jgi:hypothetical protein
LFFIFSIPEQGADDLVQATDNIFRGVQTRDKLPQALDSSGELRLPLSSAL